MTLTSVKFSPSKNDRQKIAAGMQEAFGWYLVWMKKLPETDDDWDRVVAESGAIWEKYKDYEVVQNVVIELLTDLERWT